MNSKLLGVILGGVLAFTLFMATPSTHASELDQATQFTFSRSVQLPGNVVLPAGTYWFVMMNDMPGSNNYVQVFDADRTHLYATVQTVTTEGWFPTNDSQLQFAQPSNSNQPLALMKWYYSGEVDHAFGDSVLMIGHEFVYPQGQENRFAEEPNIAVSVPSTGSVLQ